MKVLLGFVLIGVAAASAWAQGVAPSPPVVSGVQPVKVGIYQDHTIWRDLRLGASYFVNPSAASASAIGFLYEPETVLGTAALKEKVDAALLRGIAGLATSEAGQGYKFYHLPPGTTAEDWAKLPFKANKKVWIVTNDKDVFESEPSRKVVSFDAHPWNTIIGYEWPPKQPGSN